MYVNVSRSKLLINSRRNNQLRKQTKRQAQPVNSCNHCGGAFRSGGEMLTCIMCGRESGHVCQNCSHVPASSVPVE